MHAFYINLDSRTDRRAEFEGECTKMEIEAERFPGIRHPKGATLGCSASHLRVIKLAKERGLPSVIVFEDDFMFLISKEEYQTVLNTLPDDYDVVMLGHDVERGKEYMSTFGRTLEAQTASGYIVHEKAYDALIACWEASMAGFEDHPDQHWIYICDQSWKPLQNTLNWYHAIPRVGRQRPSWSDLSNAFVDYGK